MNINHLKYFQAVCMFRSISEAAEHLYISQPSLSNAIKELEKQYGVVLFHRHHRGMTLTPEGETLYRLSEDILARAEQAEKIMEGLGKGRKTLRLGIPPMIGSLVLPKIYRDFLPQNPEISMEIMENGQQELLQQLSKGYLDGALLPHTAPFDAKFSSCEADRLEIGCCTARENPIAKKRTAVPADFDQIPLVLFKDSFFQTRKIRQWFSEENVQPRILLQTEQLSTMLTMIENRAAVGFMFRNLAQNDPNLVFIPTEKPLFIRISLVWRREEPMFSAMDKLCKYMENHDLFEKEKRNV